MGTETENDYVQSGQNDEEEDVTLTAASGRLCFGQIKIIIWGHHKHNH